MFENEIQSEPKHDAIGGDADLSLGLEPLSSRGEGTAACTEASHNQNRSISERLLSGFTVVRFAFESRAAGDAQEVLSTDLRLVTPWVHCKHTKMKTSAQHFGPRCHLILQQTQQKPRRLIYFNLAGNASALADFPACWSKSGASEMFQNKVTFTDSHQ